MKGLRILFKYFKIIGGKSYFHVSQDIGLLFEPGELAGYFNDLTRKTQWYGILDQNGVSVNVLADGRKIYFATCIVQKALGHRDRRMLGEGEFDKIEFLKLCKWLLSHQDESGGWPVWSDLGLPVAFSYSAMTQGECISAFVRAWKITRNADFKKGAESALHFLCKTIEEGVQP